MAPHDESVSEQSFALGSDTLEEYASKCDREIGVTVPDFVCDDGTLVPTTHHANGKCDRPNVLNRECDPGSRFQVLANTSKAYVVAHCRKQENGAGKFGDIAVIQHNKQNGATCFYQALEPGLSGNVKAPSKGTSAYPWLTPTGTANIGCAGCHDNGPLIRSPYLTQITGANRLPGAGEVGFNRDEPYRFVGKDFAAWRVQKVEVVGNKCILCHRMGTNNVRTTQGTALDLGLRATNETQAAKNPHSASSPIWMTPGQITYSADNEEAAQEIAACASAFRLGDALPPGCKVTDYTAADDKFEDGSRWRNDWCAAPGQQFGRGDFNGDGKGDFFCHDAAGPGSKGRTWVMVSNGHDFVDGSVWLDDWCAHTGSELTTGDFNGDGKTDVLCKDPMGGGSEGRTWVALSDGDQFVKDGRWQDSWCKHEGATFGTGDFNGDKRVDVWCHDPMTAGSQGRTWVALSDGARFVSGGVWRDGWCAHQGWKFGRADFNGDKRHDFYCHEQAGAGSDGRTWVMLSDGDKFVDGSVWKNNWCKHEGARFGTGDFNGDGRADIFCKDPMESGSEGRTWVALSSGSDFGAGPVWRDNWCKADGALFGTGDFNGDKKTDIWCHDPMGPGSKGRTWVAVSNGSSFTDGSVWKDDWCKGEGSLFGTGEFDGDKKTDIWCHDPMEAGSQGRTWVATAP
jgi:hypothetical protein